MFKKSVRKMHFTIMHHKNVTKTAQLECPRVQLNKTMKQNGEAKNL